MIPSVWSRSVSFHRHFLLFSAVGVVLTAAAVAQAPPKYDSATETTLKATVEELKLVPPTGSKTLAYLLTKTGPDKDKDSVQIFLCPKSFLDLLGVAFKADDAIQITGSKVKQDGADLILAREIVLGGETLIFRTHDGKPAW